MENIKTAITIELKTNILLLLYYNVKLDRFFISQLCYIVLLLLPVLAWLLDCQVDGRCMFNSGRNRNRMPIIIYILQQPYLK